MAVWNGARGAAVGFLLILANAGLANARENLTASTVPTPMTGMAAGVGAERQLLDAHNAERQRLGLKPLEWSENLARGAQAWAERLARLNDLAHSDDAERQDAGENLWMGSGGDFSPRDMVDGFLDERKDFRPGTFPQVSRTGNWSDVGHYTQLSWPDTRQLGCGIAHNRQSEVLVCRYFPAGNVERAQVP